MRYSKTFCCICSLSATLLFACTSNGGTIASNDTPKDEPESRIVNMLKTSQDIKTVQKWDEMQLADGITYVKAQVVKASERPASINIVVAEAGAGALKTGCAEPTDIEPFPMKRPGEIAEMFDNGDEQVIVVQGGDFFRWNPSEDVVRAKDFGCRGPVHHRGKVLQDHFVPNASLPHQALSFLAVDKDGKVSIADASEYDNVKSTLQECTGGGYRPLRNGKICKGFDIYINGSYCELEDKYPFSCIGYREDGSIVMIIVDGRTEISMGLTYAEAGSIMKALGCTDAITLDGGGSAQMVIRNPKTSSFTLQNRPTDGSERTMRVFWMITRK